jgi:inner membrane transporter RhtA
VTRQPPAQAPQAPQATRAPRASRAPRAGWAPLALPATLVLTGAVSVQAGAGFANRLFGQIPPAAVTTLRLWAAALILLAIGWRGAARAVADLATRRAWRDAAATVSFGIALLFGIALATMNFAIYQSFARIPLGIAVTIEFLGPLVVAVAGAVARRNRRASLAWAGLGWAGLAAGGVLLLAKGSGGHLNLAGVAFALVSAAGWAGYILLSRATGQRFSGTSGLVIAMCVAAVLVTGPGVAAGAPRMFRPGLLAAGAAIGLLSSVIPYWLEFEALRRVPARVFGVWMSVQPAVAALIGLAMLGQRLSAAEWAGICCVVVASGGAAHGGAAHGGAAREEPAGGGADAASQALRWGACLPGLRVSRPPSCGRRNQRCADLRWPR